MCIWRGENIIPGRDEVRLNRVHRLLVFVVKMTRPVSHPVSWFIKNTFFMFWLITWSGLLVAVISFAYQVIRHHIVVCAEIIIESFIKSRLWSTLHAINATSFVEERLNTYMLRCLHITSYKDVPFKVCVRACLYNFLI